MEPEEKEQLVNRPWLYKKGQSGNPKGRPPGTFSLKEYVKKKLAAMTDEEREEYLDGLNKKDVWEMGEGKPLTKIGGEEGSPITLILQDINGNSFAPKLHSEELPNDITASDTKI